MPEPRPPYGSYAAIMATFAAGLGAAGTVGRLVGRDPQCQTALDLTVLALATFKAARTVARDPVTAPLRAPFVEGEAHSGEGEEPAGEGMQRAIGELVTCTRCVGTWVAASLATTQVIAPRFGRMLTWSLGVAGVNDFLQSGFAALGHKANELERRTSS